MVKIKNVFKFFNDKKVVDDVTLTIEKGKITSFIGPNGAGKSTLMSMVSRLIIKDEGEILIEDEELSSYNNKDLAKKISILKQSNSVNIKLTVRELVAFGRFPHSQGRMTRQDWKKVEESIDYMELGDLQHRYLDELSGGQRQRAHIAMILAQDTEYILLDEPLNNLDMRHAVQIMKTLRKLVTELGKTIVIVIHDINFASFYSDNIVALKDGKVVKQGSTNDVIKESVLKEIFDMDIDIRNINERLFCVYF